MEENFLQLQGILTSISTRKDRSLKIVFETNEVTSQDFKALFEMRDCFGWISFTETKREVIEFPKQEIKFKNNKTPSQRLRNSIYILWLRTASGIDFDAFYNLKMSTFIEMIKEKINE